MASILKFDKVEKLTKKAIPYETFFGEMNIDDLETARRIYLARQIENVLKDIFAQMINDAENGNEIDETYYEHLFGDAYRNIMNEYFDDFSIEDDEKSDELSLYMALLILGDVQKHLDDAYWFSDDRAMFVAENEANRIANVTLDEIAIADGYTHKTWVSMGDQNVRQTHRDVDGTTLPIAEPFVVGDSLMMYPLDTSLDASAEEIVNCRCTVEYI